MQMTRERAFQEIKDVLREENGISEDSITSEDADFRAAIGIDNPPPDENAAFSHSLGIDSLQLIEVIVNLEERFKVEFSDAEVQKFGALKDILNSLEEKGIISN